MNQKNNKNSEPHVLTLKLTDKFDLRMVKKKCFSIKTQYLLHMEKHKKARMKKKKKLKYHLQHGIINLNYQIGHILYQIFKIILSIFLVKRLIIHKKNICK